MITKKQNQPDVKKTRFLLAGFYCILNEKNFNNKIRGYFMFLRKRFFFEISSAQAQILRFDAIYSAT